MDICIGKACILRFFVASIDCNVNGLYEGNCLKGLGEAYAELSTNRFVKAHTQVSFLMSSLLILTASLWVLGSYTKLSLGSTGYCPVPRNEAYVVGLPLKTGRPHD